MVKTRACFPPACRSPTRRRDEEALKKGKNTKKEMLATNGHRPPLVVQLVNWKSGLGSTTGGQFLNIRGRLYISSVGFLKFIGSLPFGFST
jgi:hypothetical protein